MLHKSFRQYEELMGSYISFRHAYADFLQFEYVSSSLDDDIHLLDRQTHTPSDMQDDNQVC